MCKVYIKIDIQSGFPCYLCDADLSALLAKCDDPKMAEDPGVSEVVRQLDQACREAGFFYVVRVTIFYACVANSIICLRPKC